MAKSHSFVFMALLLFSLVFGLDVNDMLNNGDTKLDPSSILKTIVAGDEITDCVDIYKQPAFNHPLLRNHTLQLKPSSYPIESKSIVSTNSTKLTQMWHMKGEYCPEGTIPILRSSATDIPTKNTYDRLRAFNNTISSNGIPHSEFATVSTQGLGFYGITADMSTWLPKVNPSESSSSQVWVTNGGSGETIESIEAGWMVTAEKPYPSIFAYWTIDGYGKSGCYNLDCPGFVQTSVYFGLGYRLRNPSVYGGAQYQTKIKIYNDLITKNWWLTIQSVAIGYWPAELFVKMKKSAQRLQWGGRVVNTRPQGIHTSTEMGSGHFPKEGQGRAAWFHNLKYMDAFGTLNHATDVEGQATRPECYDVKVQPWDKELGATFLYGGPGYSPSCR